MSPSGLFPILTSSLLILLSVTATYFLLVNGNTATADAGQVVQDVTEETDEPTSSEEVETSTNSTLEAPSPFPGNYHYYFSDYSITWIAAQTYCKSLSKTAKLAEFRSKQEYRKASAYIMESTGGGEFWIGGMYKHSRWEWANGGLVNESIAPWIQPKPRFTRNSRLGILLYNQWEVFWTTFPKKESRRFLCQM